MYCIACGMELKDMEFIVAIVTYSNSFLNLLFCALYIFSLDYFLLSAFFWPFLTFALIGILCFLVAFSCIHQPEFAPICIYLVISPQVSLIPLTSPFPLASVRSTYPEKLAAYTVYQGLSTMGFFFKLVIFFLPFSAFLI